MNASDETKADAVARWLNGDTLDAIAADLGVAANTVKNWCVDAQQIDVPAKGWKPPTVEQIASHEPVEGWMRDAACSGLTSVMFPGRGDPVLAAKALCSRCPVVLDCATHAVRWNERQGVWGGLSEKQRRPLRREVGRWKHCLECEGRFTTAHWSAAFCSVECRVARHNRQVAESRGAA